MTTETWQLSTGTQVEKPWGHEVIWAHVPGKYCGKLLILHANQRLSQQYHEYKDETMMLLSGSAILEVDGTTMTLRQREAVHIPPNTVHRLIGGYRDAVVLEVSTTELDDVVRLADDFARVP